MSTCTYCKGQTNGGTDGDLPACDACLGLIAVEVAALEGQGYVQTFPAFPMSPADARIAARQDEPTTYVCHEQVTR